MNHDELIAAIGRARGEAFEEISGDRAQEIHLGTMSMPPAGRSRSVLGGAISDERVAWVEENSGEMTGGYLPIDIDLKIASGGRTIAILPLETYNPYFGCRVGFMRWYGDVLVWLYREKHRTILSRVAPPYESQSLLFLDDHGVMLGDDAYWLDGGLVTGRRLPNLEPLVPLPVPVHDTVRELLVRDDDTLLYVRWPELRAGVDYEAEVEKARSDGLPLPLPRDRVLPKETSSIRASLIAWASEGAPKGAAESLIDIVAAPFLREVISPVTSYDARYGARVPKYEPKPDEHVWLERLARTEARWGFHGSVESTARRHVATTVRALRGCSTS